MNKEQQLKLYKKALWHYRLANLPIIGNYFKRLLRCEFGFCYYFADYSLYDDLTILYKTIPKKTYNRYWFKEGHIPPRIECLKKAIKLCKNEIIV